MEYCPKGSLQVLLHNTKIIVSFLFRLGNGIALGFPYGFFNNGSFGFMNKISVSNRIMVVVLQPCNINGNFKMNVRMSM